MYLAAANRLSSIKNRLSSIGNRLSAITAAYALALPFVRIALLPVVDAKIQPTELLFLVLAPLALLTYKGSLWPKNTLLRAGLIAYLATNVLSAVVSQNLSAGLEALGRIYLAFLALIIARYVADDPKRHARQLLDYFLYGTAALAVCTYAGYAWAMTGELNSMVQVYGNYPYLGTVLRAKGFTAGAGMLIIVLLLPTLYAWRGWRDGRLTIWWFLLLFPLGFLTFAKEFLLLGLGLLLIDPWLRQRVWGRGRGMRGLVVGAVAIIFWLGTHYIVQQRRPFAETDLAGTNYTAGNVVWQSTDYQIIETSYTELKKAGVTVAARHPVVGVGPGQFGRALPAEKAAGRYPASLPNYDPHSTWLGALSETGTLGFVALLFLVFVCWRSIRSCGTHVLPEDIRQSLLIFLLLIAILSVSKDVMNFRFLWFGVGVLLCGTERGSGNVLRLS